MSDTIYNSTILDYFIARIPISIASILDWRIQKTLGKGIGFGSVVHEVRTVKEFLVKLHIKEPTVLDIGANIGQYALEFIRQCPSVQIQSFEPGTEAFLELSRQSQSFPDWTVYKFGFGHSISNMILYSDNPGSASSSLISKNSSFDHGPSLHKQEVSIRTIDDFIQKEMRVIPDVIKLDVEGFEFACLNGAEKYIDEVKIVQFEFGQTNIESRVFFRDFWIFFSAKNFEIYRITAKFPIHIREYNESLETFAVTNYLALNCRFSKTMY